MLAHHMVHLDMEAVQHGQAAIHHIVVDLYGHPVTPHMELDLSRAMVVGGNYVVSCILIKFQNCLYTPILYEK